MDDTKLSFGAVVRQDAMRYLAKREYGYLELKRILLKKFAEEIVEQVLRELKIQSLQSDMRYTQTVVKSGIEKGEGPLKLTAKLRKNGIKDEYIDEALSGVLWLNIAQYIRKKKYGEIIPDSSVDKAKQARFLLQKGHGQEQIRQVLNIEDYMNE